MRIFLSALLSLTFTLQLDAQGCSDAGLCTVHSIKNNTAELPASPLKNEVVIGFNYGKGEKSISYNTTTVEYTRRINNRTSLTGKIDYKAIAGEVANTDGFGDLFLSLSHAFDVKSKWQKSFVIGVKLPLNESGRSRDGIDLPMPYQTSLGTSDLIMGINFMYSSFGATVALQQPLSSANGNAFLPENFPSHPLASGYLPTNKFSRKGDLLLRTSYNLGPDKKFSLRPGLLFIYHLSNDTYVDNDDNRHEIANSNGLTLNGNIFFNYKLSERSGFEFSVGTPFVVRTKRPDGLIRSFVAALDYRFTF